MFEPVKGGQPGRIETLVVEQATSAGYSKAPKTVASWPVVPRRVYFLHYAGVMLISKTLPQWLSEISVEEFEGATDAVTAASVHSVSLLMRKGLKQCIEEGCCGWARVTPNGPDTPKLLERVSSDWLKANTVDPDFTWDTLEQSSVERLVRKELWPQTRAYIRAHRKELVKPK